MRDFIWHVSNIDRGTIKEMDRAERSSRAANTAAGNNTSPTSDSDRRAEELIFISDLMRNQTPVETISGRYHPLRFTVADMEAFGRSRLVEYEGVSTTLNNLKAYFLEESNVRLGVSIVTNTPSPIIRQTSLISSGAVDWVEGQEFHDITDAHGNTLAQPDSAFVGSDTKPQRIHHILDQYGLDLAHTTFMGDGHSDMHAMRVVAAGKGRVICIKLAETIHQERQGISLTKRQLGRDTNDNKRHRELRGEIPGLTVVTGDYLATRGSVSKAEKQIRQVLREQIKWLGLGNGSPSPVPPGLDAHGGHEGLNSLCAS